MAMESHRNKFGRTAIVNAVGELGAVKPFHSFYEFPKDLRSVFI